MGNLLLLLTLPLPLLLLLAVAGSVWRIGAEARTEAAL
jgi:hypothetical protein